MTFEYTATNDGLRIRDAIKNATLHVRTGSTATPSAASTDVFRVPLDDAVTVVADRFELPTPVTIFVRDDAGSLLATGAFDRPLDLDPGTYVLETTYEGFRLFLRVEETRVRLHDRPDATRLTFDAETAITIGVRSRHDAPGGVVATAQDPRDMMAAVSTFGSALTTFSPERSWPSLRGHPPELAVRGQTAIPDHLSTPDTGVTLEVPPEYAAVFMAAPVAYYLGATVEPGLDPALHAAGRRFALDDPGLADALQGVLRHCLLLDCVVRTEGLYRVDLLERRRLEARLDVDVGALYDLPLDERTAAYLDVPMDATRDLLQWTHVADVDPVPLNAEALPYLAYRLAAIRSPAELDRPPVPDAADRAPAADESSAPTSSGSRPAFDVDGRDGTTRVVPAPFDGQFHLWLADGVPAGGVKPTLGAYLRSVDASPTAETVEMHVVVGDDTATGRLPALGTSAIEVTRHEQPTVAELQDLLLADVDFLYYVGAVTPEGLTCLDGTLDVRTLPRTGVSAFYLDGADTYRQGLALVRVGAVAGIVTLDDVGPPGAFGHDVAALLDHGFSMGAASAILASLAETDAFAVVGDGDHQLHIPGILPSLYEPTTPDQPTDGVTCTATTYATLSHRIGYQLSVPHGIPADVALLGSVDLALSEAELDAVLDHLDDPILADGELHWPAHTSRDALRSLFE